MKNRSMESVRDFAFKPLNLREQIEIVGGAITIFFTEKLTPLGGNVFDIINDSQRD